ncbi:heavy metal translocating P-type ATPase [Thalassospira sp.]|uniref:heavy metal translocating P-type ATPase n=1 Tax=Thalassospira sp. TaxID=1912094 RepID=UPI000C40175E|nr:heavy metal translocating P-type ATPase [Thalassospira sp.]MBC06043.1 copper-translocating P-type ATPase [Thalassospira sp.]|tara:strand:- start:1185 stop:3674 length:2490 start_codon:yes stop_codon:yes gene_type:complete
MDSRTDQIDAPTGGTGGASAGTAAANDDDVSFQIEGMTCANCAGRVEKALAAVDGVSEASVNFALNSANVHFDRSKTDAASLAKAVNDAGYSVVENQLSFDVDGMSCANCALRVEKALAALPGVSTASVNFALERADVSAVSDSVNDARVIKAIEDAGYHATSRNGPASDAANEESADSVAKKKTDKSLILLAVSALLTAPLVLQMVWMNLGVNYHLPAWVELVLATPVQFYIGARFYKGAFAALRHRSANMDVLVALGTSAAYFLSVYNMITANAGQAHLYFEASAAIVTLILAGKIMEERAKRGASAAIRELMALRPRRARKLVEGEGEQDVAVESLSVGDIVRVLPGERLPVDGTVRAGDSELDESLITGETRPVARKPGDAVVGGAVNGTGRLDIEVRAVGDDTTLSRIIRLVEQAQTGKAPVQKLVDRVSAVFVPVVVGIALLTLAAWLFTGFGAEASIVAAVSVLVIACPCALGLATPTALVAGTGSAARNGILIRNFDALEQAHNVDTVIFDKTGTLTEGTPTVRDVEAVNGMDRNDLLRLTAAVQAASEHPLARAIVSLARDEGQELSDINNFKGKTGAGVMAEVDGRKVIVGSEALLSDQNIDLPADDIAQAIKKHEGEGRTVILIAIDGSFAGYMTLEDRIRENAKQAIADLKARGIASIMLSGDSQDVASHVARELGLERGEGRIRPQDKALEVEKLRKEGRHVAMVGDGINDAPALAAADVGIAMGGGTDVAMETAGITLMRSDPALVSAAIDISIATRRKIAQNLFWAFAYNVVGVPLAALGVLSPAIAGAAMALSSVSVVGNSLTLRRWNAKGRR